MAFWAAIWFGVTFFFSMIRDWLFIFISPIKNVDILWIIVPIWISWFFAEFFQEKKGTSFGNAISNGAVPLWVGIDWTRYLTNLLMESKVKISLWSIIPKYLLCLIVFAYGFTIIFYGIKTRSFVHFFGRIREITYVLLVFSPVIYGIIPLTWRHFLICAIFFPVYYYIIEIIDYYTPDPGAITEDGSKSKDSTPNMFASEQMQSPFNSGEAGMSMRQGMNSSSIGNSAVRRP